MFEVIRWVSIGVLWLCIIANWLMIFRNHKLGKQYKKLIDKAEEDLIAISMLRDRYEEWRGLVEGVSDEGRNYD